VLIIRYRDKSRLQKNEKYFSKNGNEKTECEVEDIVRWGLNVEEPEIMT